MPTYEFVVDFETPENDTKSFWANQIHPFIPVCWVYMYAEVAHEEYPGSFGVSDVRDVIDVSWMALPQSSATSALFNDIGKRPTYPSPMVSLSQYKQQVNRALLTMLSCCQRRTSSISIVPLQESCLHRPYHFSPSDRLPI